MKKEILNNKDENAHRFALSGEILEREREREWKKEREIKRATNNRYIPLREVKWAN